MTGNLPDCNLLLHIYFFGAGFLLGSNIIIHVSSFEIMKILQVLNLHYIHVGSAKNASERVAISNA